MTSSSRLVIAYRDPSLNYPSTTPFDPDQPFPEYPYEPIALSPDNRVYGAVREVLRRSGLDANRFGRADWNPLADLVQPGQTVLIKPNWVRHFHVSGEDLFSVITHPAVLRPLIDYAFKAVGPQGRIWVMDAPQFDADFEKIKEICQLAEFEQALQNRGVPLTIADLRSLIVRIDKGVVIERRQRHDWSCEGVELDLGADSELAELGESLRHVFGSDYDRRLTAAFHHNQSGRPRHCYRIARRVLEADLVISVPKLKTHKKNGVTLNIKNMIGINTDKNYIPHYRVGAPSAGGDEFPDTERLSKKIRRWLVRRSVDLFLGRLGRWGEQVVHGIMTFLLSWRKAVSRSPLRKSADAVDIFYHTVQGDDYRTGNWWGNDTCWRTCLDINKLLRYATVQGQLATTPQRAFFSIIDGIVGGDEDGPMAPTPRPEGVLLAGFDPLSVDHVACQIMGFDPLRIREIRRAWQLTKYPLLDGPATITVDSNQRSWTPRLQPGADLKFRPHFAWRYYLQDPQHD